MSTSPLPDPFDGVKGATPAEQIDATGRLKIAILGLPKSGKSWFAATAPKPIMFYDFDDRAISLAGKQGIMVKTLQDKSQRDPQAMKALETDLSNFQYRKLKGLPIPTTFVFDTVTYLKKAIENEVFKQDPNLARKVKTGADMTKDYIMISRSYDVVNAVQGYVQYLIAEFASLGNFIMVFHERDQKDKEKSTPEKAVFTGKVTVDPQYLENTLTLFNEIFRIEATGTIGNTGTKYTVTCKTNFEVNASTTLLVDATEPPDLMAMIAKHKANLAKQLTTK